MALTKITGSGIGTVTDNVVITSDDPTITMTDSSGTNDIATLQSTSGALIVTVRDGTSDGEIIFKGNTGSAVTEHARIANTGLMTVISEGNAVQTSVQQGLAKAFQSANAAAVLEDSHNIASGTDNGTGDYTFAFTNNMNNDNFSAVGTVAQDNGEHYVIKARAVGSYTVKTEDGDDGTSASDRKNSTTVHGDLA